MFLTGDRYEPTRSWCGSIKIGLLLEPIIEYIISMINEIKLGINNTKKKAIVFHLVVRLNAIIVNKCLKYNIKINSADKVMEYLEYLCIMIKYNENTKEFIKLVNKIDKNIQYEENKNNNFTPRKKAKLLRKSTSSIDDYDEIFDITTLNDIDIQRW